MAVDSPSQLCHSWDETLPAVCPLDHSHRSPLVSSFQVTSVNKSLCCTLGKQLVEGWALNQKGFGGTGCVCRRCGLAGRMLCPGRPPEVQVAPPKHDALQTVRLCSALFLLACDGACLRLGVLYCCRYWYFVRATQALSVRCLWYMWGRCFMYGTLGTNMALHSYVRTHSPAA